MKRTEENYCLPARVLVETAFRDLNSFVQLHNQQRSGRKPQTNYRMYAEQLYADPSARIERDFWNARRLSP